MDVPLTLRALVPEDTALDVRAFTLALGCAGSQVPHAERCQVDRGCSWDVRYITDERRSAHPLYRIQHGDNPEHSHAWTIEEAEGELAGRTPGDYHAGHMELVCTWLVEVMRHAHGG